MKSNRGNPLVREMSEVQSLPAAPEKPMFIGLFRGARKFHSATNGRTKRELGSNNVGVLAEKSAFVLGGFVPSPFHTLIHGDKASSPVLAVGRGGFSCPPVPAIPYLTVTSKSLISHKSVSHGYCNGTRWAFCGGHI
jgi:hypothetical protein